MLGYFIYFLYDINRNLLYIGKSINISERIKQHLSISNFKSSPWKKTIDKKSIILYECENPTDLDIYETYFINKYKPLYNKDKVFNHISTIELPYLKPINPFEERFNDSLLILNALTKANEQEYQTFIETLDTTELYLSINKDNRFYLDENKFGSLAIKEEIIRGYQVE